MKSSLDPLALIPVALDGDRRALARLITIVENERPGDEDVLASLYSRTGNAWTTGVTGAPGAGKSTLTDRLIGILRDRETEVAVLAVDPSSPFSGGAILGDRIRMQDRIDDRGVYIRSMASRGHLGGISEATPRAVVVLDGVGFPEILVETVGVGQAEVEIAAAADTTVVVLNPGWGDSVQVAKAGLLEIGDIFVVNKADRDGVGETVRDLKQMLELGQHDDWQPSVVTTIATTGEGLEELISAVLEHRMYLEKSGRLAALRRSHVISLFEQAVNVKIKRQMEGIRGELWEQISDDVAAHRLDPWNAARTLVGDITE